MGGEILTEERQLIVYIEIEERLGLNESHELFKLFRGEEIKCTEFTLSFGAMYASELANVLIKLDNTFNDYVLCFSSIDGKGLKIKMEFH